MVGFAPLLVTVLGWLAIRPRARYRSLRSLLFVSLGIAVFFYVLYPTAPPRLVPGLGIADTVGMAGHDTGSFAGIRINPYAAMPSMHFGWSVLLAIVGYRTMVALYRRPRSSASGARGSIKSLQVVPSLPPACNEPAAA